MPPGAPGGVGGVGGQVSAVAGELPDAARTRHRGLELHRAVPGQRQHPGDAGEQAEARVQVQHQLQVVVVGRRFARHLAQEQAAHLLPILPRIGQAQHRQRFLVRGAAADQVQGGIQKQPLPVSHPQRGMEHQLVAGQEEERQIEHRHLTHEQGGPLQRPLARSQQPHAVRAQLVVGQARIRAGGHPRPVQDDGAVAEAGNRVAGEAEHQRAGRALAPVAGEAVHEHHLGGGQVERHARRAHLLRLAAGGGHPILDAAARGEQFLRLLIDHFVGADQVLGVILRLPYGQFHPAAQDEGARAGRGVGAVLGMGGLPHRDRLLRRRRRRRGFRQGVEAPQPGLQVLPAAGVVEA